MAPSLVTCLTQTSQPLDPNLKQLADSYTAVLEQLGPEGVEKLRQSHALQGDNEVCAVNNCVYRTYIYPTNKLESAV